MTSVQRRILVVAGDRDLRDSLSRMLEDEYEVLKAVDPRTALGVTLKRSPHCILLALELPDPSALQLCTILADMSATRLIPVIAITSRPAAQLAEFSNLIRRIGFIERPFSAEQVKARIAGAVGASRGERRCETRVRLRVAIRIAGEDAGGNAFETELVTNDVSAHGFSISTSLPVAMGTTVHAWLPSSEQSAKGQALAVRVEKREPAGQAYGFQFIRKPANWVIR
jgi:DNA-binding response OmpR family regulator